MGVFFDGPYDGESFDFVDVVFLFRFVEGGTGVRNDMPFLMVPVLGKDGAKSTQATVCLQDEDFCVIWSVELKGGFDGFFNVFECLLVFWSPFELFTFLQELG